VSAGEPRPIAGLVRDESGAPIKDARVYFTQAPVPVPDVAALTGADGTFSLTAPVDGTYTLECNAEGFSAARATVASQEGAGLDFTLRRP
jgi:hypothetical protein